MAFISKGGPLGFLECEGPAFSPRWSLFRELLRDDLLTGDVSIATLALASELVHDYEGMAFSTRYVYSILQGADETELSGFCLLGFACALAVMLRPEAEAQGIADEDRHRMGWLFTSVLGAGRPLDLFSETQWPVRSEDVLLPIVSTRFSRLEEAFDARPTAWQPAATTPRVTWQMLDDLPRQASHSRSIRVAVFGTHAMMALEPVHALDVLVAPRLGVSFEWSHFGQWAYCGRLGTGSVHDCDEPITRLFASWFRDDQELSSESEFLSRFYTLYSGSPFLSAADLLVVTRPYLVGWMLRAVDPNTPILHVYDCPLLFGTPEPWRVPLMLSVRSLIRQGPISEHDAIVQIAGPYCSATIHEQVGEWMSCLPMTSLYVDARYTPGPVPRVMLFRSPFWHSLPGIVFRSVFDRLVGAAAPPVEVLHAPEKYLGWPELSSLHAAALFPDNLNKGQFYDFYMMAMPMFLPSAALYAKIVCALNDYNDNKPEFRGFLSRSAREAGVGAEAWEPFDPFFNCSTPSARYFSATTFVLYELTDYALYPHLRHFDSASSLVSQLSAPDARARFEEQSSAMHAHAETLRERAADFYVRAVHALVSVV